MKNAIKGKHAGRVVLVSSGDYGMATGRRLTAEGATVFAVGQFGELRNVGPFAQKNWRRERKQWHLVWSSFSDDSLGYPNFGTSKDTYDNRARQAPSGAAADVLAEATAASGSIELPTRGFSVTN